eukprot:8175080-Alexandrium_andersonii.AAC.1
MKASGVEFEAACVFGVPWAGWQPIGRPSRPATSCGSFNNRRHNVPAVHIPSDVPEMSCT